MRSARLPGKVLLPIPLNGGKPIIQWIVDQVRRSQFEKKIILATSVNSENDPMAAYCAAQGIECFRGDEDNVLSRFIELTKLNKFDTVVRLTGDNPIVDIRTLDKAIEFHHQNNYQYTRSEGLPLGMNFEIITPGALLRLQDQMLSEQDKEHVTLFIRNDAASNNGVYKSTDYETTSHLRLTVDYPSDYLVVSTVLSLMPDNSADVAKELRNICQTLPWIFEVNRTNIQKVHFNTEDEENNKAIAILEQYEMRRAAAALKRL
jgi:spore coat polysaccharide biosynthesis protein SpsF